MSDDEPESKSSSIVVLLALGANLGVGLLKLAAGLISGSGALLAEAAHSAGDTTTEILLLVAQRRSQRPADVRHPFGYGKERYFWSLLAAGAIFVSGAAFSIYEGLHTIFGPTEESHLIWLNYLVLGGAALLEGTSLIAAIRAVRRQRRSRRWSIRDYVHQNDDPTENSVVLEDSAALVGLVLAAAGVALHQATGDQMWDGIAALAIGVLLLVVAFLLARTCKDLLIGQQADPKMLREIADTLREQDEVEDVVDVLSMLTGTDQVLLCVRADFVDALSAADLEQACVRVADKLREQYPDLDEIFIQPAAGDDPRVVDRVKARYGRTLTR